MNKTGKEHPLVLTILYFVRWSVLSVVIGLAAGAVGTAFGFAVSWAVGTFGKNHMLLFALPVLGLLIMLIYKVLGEEKNRGTNMVLEAVYSENKLKPTMAPAIFIGSVLSHLGGGSCGREGAALQMGGSIGSTAAKLFRLDSDDTNIAIMCGMTSVFSALFGTPMAAAIFPLEMISVGVIYYAALVPCIFASFVSAGVAKFFQLAPTTFGTLNAPEIGFVPMAHVVLLGLITAACAFLFITVMYNAEAMYEKFCPNRYIRVAAGGLIVIVFSLLTGYRYNNTGANLILAGLSGESRPLDFILKMLLTALSIGAGYKGGEIVPSFAIGASVGGIYASVLGLDPTLTAACAMLAFFAAVTNAPMASLLIGFEMFGYDPMPYFAVVIAVGYMLSGYYSLYSAQKIAYSKIRAAKIGQKVTEPPLLPFLK
ncbi:chloride channel protein [[Clostridium] aminophilum]|uniref:chloride channel protein n=1 Tax=[Clostridium] aminophilum TaxID=1526 RepID=UPI0026EE0309|nr:chloride channel protein [[Clostridium] aminophilum]MDD6196633.1 chloride channel protein [[Clostridium] aminophilum]